DGRGTFGILSEMCLEASRELKLIDPKINLRVDRNTPQEIFRLGTRLTKVGLGFPQYSNDDVVIPGLTALGYKIEDARDYTVAACWEFIIPGKGMDIPNIGALSFPAVTDRGVRGSLAASCSFEGLMDEIRKEIKAECLRIAGGIKNLWMIPAPLMSVMMEGCIANARDVSMGAGYNNFGFHGTGLATAVDSLAAIKKYVYEEGSLKPSELIDALDNNFEGHDELLARLRNDSPKFGNGDGDTDKIASDLLEAFSDALKGLRNERGGIIRAGTGSAMFYLWHAAETGASPDGRLKGEPFGANYSPSLFAKLRGPVSVIKAFTVPDLKKTINGGPLTMEFHSSLFSDDESMWKVADLVRYFVERGGHQLQLNAVNRDVLLDAQRHPEKYKQLIVRIWGWSAYFVELDREYQDHVISRQEYI
ncbi:MAG: pyruvate formate lyase family protein, partial [Eubacteriales bacterium]|nr:pyruvate formate lyase family protein [Eubacteriales bacterium]